MYTDHLNSSFPQIGAMSMPPGFPHQDLCTRGRPRHHPLSRFRLRHPQMPCSRRAKIFAPFNALAGFSEMIDAVSAGSAEAEGRE